MVQSVLYGNTTICERVVVHQAATDGGKITVETTPTTNVVELVDMIIIWLT
jgi:hypothetical protein